MKKDNLFKRLRYSIYDMKKMSIYCREGFGRALLYSLVLCVLLGLVKSVYAGISINKDFNGINKLLSQDKYSFEINNGELNIKTSPIKQEKSGFLIYVNDEVTLEQKSDIKNILVNSDFYIIVLKDGIEVGGNSDIYPVDPYIMTYSDFGLDKITNKELAASLVLTKVLLIAMNTGMQMIFTFMNYLFYAVIVAVFSTLSAALLKIRMKYSQILSLVLYAATLPSIIVLIFSFISPSVYFESVGIIGTLLYTILILREMKKDGIDYLV